MASMNTTAKGRMLTTNRSGHAAYKLDAKTKLVTMAITTMLGEPKFYGDNTDELIKLAEELCKSGEGEFVAKLAVWVRTKGNLRSVSHALVAVVAHECPGKPYIRAAVRKVASMRGDDGTEIIATGMSLYGNGFKHQNGVRRGIRDALANATPYSIAKYQSSARSLKLRDVLRMTHPNAWRDDTTKAMGECVAGTLAVPKSWETELSARGNTKEVWDELIAEDKVGVMALVRNLRNIIRAGADLDPVIAKLTDREVIRRSRMLPFRFYSAYRELSNAGLASSRVSRALDIALVLSCQNVDRLPGRTAVLIDRSGSMGARVSAKSEVTCRDIAAVFGAMATHISDDAAVFYFGSAGGIIPMTGLSIISDVGMVPSASGGTDMAAGFDALMRMGFDEDRVIVLSDNEVNGGGWWGRSGKQTIQRKMDEYRSKVGHDVWCHAIDLQGYGTSQFIGPKTNVMAGWSAEILRFISLVEDGFGGLVEDIEGMEL